MTDRIEKAGYSKKDKIIDDVQITPSEVLEKLAEMTPADVQKGPTSHPQKPPIGSNERFQGAGSSGFLPGMPTLMRQNNRI